jgi:hypothetical protein
MKKFFTTISIILIGYFFIKEYVKQDTNVEKHTEIKQDISDINQSSQNIEGGFIERTISKVMINVLKTPQGQETFIKMIQPLNSDGQNTDSLVLEMNNSNLINKIFEIETNGNEKSTKAICGNIVDVEYLIQDFAKGTSETKRENIELGSQKVDISLSTIIVGMSEGQKRKAMIKDKFFQNGISENQMPKKIEVTLHKIIEKQFLDLSKIKIFDNVVNRYVPYLCGDKIDFEIKISKIDGTEIFKSKAGETDNYRVGDRSFPMIFGYGVFNKTKSGTRTIITPAKYLKTFDDKVFPTFNIKNNNSEYYIIDIKDKPILNKNQTLS